MCQSNDLILALYTLSLCSTREFLVDKESILGEFSRNFLCHKEAYLFFNIINIYIYFHARDNWNKWIETFVFSMSHFLSVFRIASWPLQLDGEDLETGQLIVQADPAL